MQVYGVSAETYVKRPGFNSGGNAKYCSILGTFTCKEFKDSAVKEDQKCYRCGLGGHFARDQNCPARSETFAKCHMKGHFASVCKISKRKKEQKSMKKEKSERGGVNSLKSGAEFKEDEYAFIVEFKKQAQKTVQRLSICKLVVWLLEVYPLTPDLLLVILWIRRDGNSWRVKI